MVRCTYQCGHVVGGAGDNLGLNVPMLKAAVGLLTSCV